MIGFWIAFVVICFLVVGGYNGVGGCIRDSEKRIIKRIDELESEINYRVNELEDTLNMVEDYLMPEPEEWSTDD